MKYLVLFSCLICINACNNNNTLKKPPDLKVVNYDTSLHKINDTWMYKGRLFSGFMIEIEKDGMIVYELPILNGKANGLAKGKYHSGEKLMERIYIDGNKEGVFTQWWPNGNKRYLFNYKKDLFDGTQTVYFPDGKKQQESMFENGNEEGLQQIWNNQGELISNYTIRNKKLYGIKSAKSCLPVVH